MRQKASSPQRAGAAGEGGFTLIEAIVALAIAALGLGMLLSSSGIGLGNAGLAQQYIEAVRRAQSRLAVVASSPIVPGEGSGDDGGGYTWQVRVSPPERGASADAPFLSYPITVTVSWQSGILTKSVTLRTMRAGMRPNAHG